VVVEEVVVLLVLELVVDVVEVDVEVEVDVIVGGDSTKNSTSSLSEYFPESQTVGGVVQEDIALTVCVPGSPDNVN